VPSLEYKGVSCRHSRVHMQRRADCAVACLASMHCRGDGHLSEALANLECAGAPCSLDYRSNCGVRCRCFDLYQGRATA
jgi:hypothetical protein